MANDEACYVFHDLSGDCDLFPFDERVWFTCKLFDLVIGFYGRIIADVAIANDGHCFVKHHASFIGYAFVDPLMAIHNVDEGTHCVFRLDFAQDVVKSFSMNDRDKRRPPVCDQPTVPAVTVVAETLGIETEEAKKALVALVRAGYVVAPKEPTNVMLEAYITSYGQLPQSPASYITVVGKARRRWAAMAEVGTRFALRY